MVLTFELTGRNHKALFKTHNRKYLYIFCHIVSPVRIWLYVFIPEFVHPRVCTLYFLISLVFQVYWGILYWWVMCALDENCIAPKKAQLFCNFKHGYRNYFANCHRFDMSALNVLASNLYGYDDRVYTARQQDVVTIVKHKSSMYKLRREQCGVGL